MFQPIIANKIGISPRKLKKQAISTNFNQKPKAISLFSGCGGLDIGVEAAGFKTLCCIEIDPFCCETLVHNQPAYISTARILNQDICQVDPITLMKEHGIAPRELDLLFGGPPCQTFSQIGKQDGLSDARGMPLFEIVRLAEAMRPKALLIENVKALATAKDPTGQPGGILIKLLSQLRKLGYTPNLKTLNAADYGVAQRRERLFVVAFKGDTVFQFPNPSHGPEGQEEYKTVREALGGLGRVATRNRRDREDNHVDVTPDGDRRRISYVTEGTYLAAANAPPEIKCRLTKKDTTKFLRLSRHGQSNTLRCGEIFFHPIKDRYLTPREYMRLHGFPDNYQLRGPIRGRSGRVRQLDQHRQIANSVPPPIAQAVAYNIYELLTRSTPHG